MLKKHNAVTCWLALEKVDEENGCIHYVKGSHKFEYRPHGRSNVLGFSQVLLILEIMMIKKILFRFLVNQVHF